MQRLDAPVHDLREAREVLDRADVQPGLGQLRRGAAGGDDLDAEVRQAAREIHDAALVRDREQRPPDPDVPGCVIRPAPRWREHSEPPVGKTPAMSEHGRTPRGTPAHRRSARAGPRASRGPLDDAKDHRGRAQDAQGLGEAEEVAGDWEDEAPDRPGGDDAEGAQELTHEQPARARGRGGPRRGQQADRLGQQRCSSGRSASWTASGSLASGISIAPCRMIGPVSTPSSTKWTVTPKTCTP